MSRLEFTTLARLDLRELLERIARDRPRVAIEFVEKIEQRCRLLADFPLMGTARDDLSPGLRLSSVGNYVICFRPAEDGITVVRVLHGAQDFDQMTW